MTTMLLHLTSGPKRASALALVLVVLVVSFTFTRTEWNQPWRSEGFLTFGNRLYDQRQRTEVVRNANAKATIGREDVLLVDRPGTSFRDGLSKKYKYITGGELAGWNNQVIAQLNILHLAYLIHQSPYNTTLIPLLIPFIPDVRHLGHADSFSPLLPFSRVFDVPQLEDVLGFPVIGMDELKHSVPCCGKFTEEQAINWGANQWDQMSCWSAEMTRSQGKGGVAGWADLFRMDVSWTPLPKQLFYPQPNPFTMHTSSILNLILPSDQNSNRMRDEYLAPGSWMASDLIRQWDQTEGGGGGGGKLDVKDVFGFEKEGWRKPELEEDGDVFCLDEMYWISEQGMDPFRDQHSIGPWQTVGKHVYWNPEVVEMAKETIFRILERDGNAHSSLPALITVHIRRTDFLPECLAHNPPEKCGPVSRFSDAVDETIQRLRVEKGLKLDRIEDDYDVIVTTDESDPEYLSELRSKGWHVVDHEQLQTAETYGNWYPTILDCVILSMGNGFVGTHHSTMSILAGQRVEDWNDGVYKLIDLADVMYRKRHWIE